MNTTAHITARLATVADITPEWIEAVASALARDGQAYDLTTDGLSIQIQSINTGHWMPLNLPTNGHLFATQQDARATYTAICGCIINWQTTPAHAAAESFFSAATRTQARRALNTMGALAR